MPLPLRRAVRFSFASFGALAALFFAGLAFGIFGKQQKPTPAPSTKAPAARAEEAARLNSTGVAYMNQQRFADAQKQFEAALASDGSYALARLNLGISLLAQQKTDAARAALTDATAKIPGDPYAWYNLGLAYKDLSDPAKATEAFRRVT